jgi:hypothetical protein
MRIGGLGPADAFSADAGKFILDQPVMTAAPQSVVAAASVANMSCSALRAGNYGIS